MADFQARIPQRIEHEFDDALAPAGLLVGQQEQQIDIGARRQCAAAIAADRHDGDPLGLGRIGRAIERAAREIEQRVDDLVLPVGQEHGAARALAVAHQAALGLEPRLGQVGLDQFDDLLARIGAAGVRRSARQLRRSAAAQAPASIGSPWLAMAVFTCALPVRAFNS